VGGSDRLAALATEATCVAYSINPTIASPADHTDARRRVSPSKTIGTAGAMPNPRIIRQKRVPPTSTNHDNTAQYLPAPRAQRTAVGRKVAEPFDITPSPAQQILDLSRLIQV
jgi:hypothetical protein